MNHFNGPEYKTEEDHKRLSLQLDRIKDLMLDGEWRTLEEIQDRTCDPQASISAQLRHLIKERFGAYTVNRRARGHRALGLYEYQLVGRDTVIEIPETKTRGLYALINTRTGVAELFASEEQAEAFKRSQGIIAPVYKMKDRRKWS